MGVTLPKYLLKVPSETTRFRDLGKELREMGISIESILESFDYNGADPGLALARVAALEAWRASAQAKIADIESAIASRQVGTTPYVAGTGGSGSGYTWSTLQTVTFDTPFPTGTRPNVHATPYSADFIFYTSVFNIDHNGFQFRVIRLGTSLPAGTLMWTAELQTV